MKIYSYLVGFVILLTVFIDPTPHSIGFVELIFIALISLILGSFIIRLLISSLSIPKSHIYFPMVGIYIILFFSLFPAVIINETSPYLWVRGIIPFLLYLIVIPLIHEAYSQNSLKNIYIPFIFLILSGCIITLREIEILFSTTSFITVRSLLPSHSFQPHILASFSFLVGYLLEIKSKRRKYLIILSLFLFIGLILTGSRSLLLLTVIIIVFALLYNTKNGFTKKYILYIIGIFGFTFFSLTTIQNISNIINILIMRFSMNILQDPRIDEFKAIWSEFLKHPIIGNGLGYQYSYTRSVANVIWEGGYSHNIISYFLLTTGLIGLLFLLWFVYSIVRELITTYGLIKDRMDEYRALFLGIFLCLISCSLYALYQSIFRGLGFPLIISISLAGIICLKKIVPCDLPERSPDEFGLKRI